MRKTLEERFWAKVDKTGDCWVWTAGRFHDGYGKFGVNKQMVKAHRLAWELAGGPIPDGMCVCHRCDTPACVNAEHLFLGTHADNMADMKAKGRHFNGRAKLTQSDVIAMRYARVMFGVTGAALSKAMGISRCHANKICAGIYWKTPPVSD